MASLLPTGHVSAAVGVLYMLALELRKAQESETAIIADGGVGSSLIILGGDKESFYRGADVIALEVKHIGLVNREDDLEDYACVQIIFGASDGRELPNRQTNLVIEPPYTSFFSARRRAAYSHGTVSFYIDEVQAVTRFRRRLMAGELTAAITDVDGHTTVIPPKYWAAEICSEVLRHDVHTLIRIDQNDIFGRVSFPRRDIDRMYSVSLAVEAQPQDQEAFEPAILLPEPALGRRPIFDAVAFAHEAAAILYGGKPASLAELARLTLDAYEAANLPGGRPKMAWARKALAPLWRKIEPPC